MLLSNSNSYSSNNINNIIISHFLWLWALVVTASVVLSPRLGDSGLLKFLRIDDILLPITLILTLFLIPRAIVLKKVISAFILLVLFNSIVLLITHYFGFNRVGLIEKILPACKNIQYLIYFCFFFALTSKFKTFPKIKLYLVSIFGCFVPNSLYALLQVITLNFTGYYGIEILNERSPSLTGAVFHVATIICSLIFQLENQRNIKLFWLIMTALHASFTALTGSRGASVALLTYFSFISISAVLGLLKNNKISKQSLNIILSITIVILTCLLIIVLNPSLASKVDNLMYLLPNRASKISLDNVGEEARLENWSNLLNEFSHVVHQFPMLGLFGLGSGGVYEVFGVLINAADSQYVYTIISGGLIGSLLYINAFIRLYKFGLNKISQSSLPLLPIFMGLFWSFIAFSISQEIFHLSKPGGLFWITSGLLLGTACSDFNQRHTSHPHLVNKVNK